MDIVLILSLVLGITAFITFNVVLEAGIFESMVFKVIDIADVLSERLGQYNTKRYIERIKREKIVTTKENVFTKYNRLVSNIILDFNMPFTLESFTSVLMILFSILILVVMIFMQSITVAVIFSVSIFIAIMTYFVMQSKIINAEKIESIMDAEDLICPLARDGVLVAIKKVMESEEYISSTIRPYFQQFIDNCENNGYSFRQAMTLLNRQLGPKFDNFAKKAIIFEYNERKGMADIFLDIVDENAVLREINARKDRIFRKMNRDFLIKTVMIILFFFYALSIEGFKEFMMNNELGKIINTILISVICVSFARCQALQGNLGAGGKTK